MKEESSLAKRLSGLIALSLVLAMTMGITASAANTYYIKPGCETLYTDEGCSTNPIDAATRIYAGDSIKYNSGESGSVRININGVHQTTLNEIEAYSEFTAENGPYYITVRPWNPSGIDVGDGVKVNAVIDLTTTPPESISSPTKPSCNHRAVELRTVRETTVTQDGIRAWFCVDCDEKLSEEMLSSYAFFLQSIIYQIEHAESGSTVEISSEIWNSLSQDVMLALAARRDINIVFTLRYNHEDYRIEIPAGTTIDTRDPYYGPLYLGQLYGMTRIEK